MENLLKKYEKIIAPFLDELYYSAKHENIVIKKLYEYKIKIFSYGREYDTINDYILRCDIRIEEFDNSEFKFILKDVINLKYKK